MMAQQKQASNQASEAILNVDCWVSSFLHIGKPILLQDPETLPEYKDKSSMFIKYPAGTVVPGWDTSKVVGLGKIY